MLQNEKGVIFMKKFTMPKIEVESFMTENVITLSGTGGGANSIALWMGSVTRAAAVSSGNVADFRSAE